MNVLKKENIELFKKHKNAFNKRSLKSIDLIISASGDAKTQRINKLLKNIDFKNGLITRTNFLKQISEVSKEAETLKPVYIDEITIDYTNLKDYAPQEHTYLNKEEYNALYENDEILNNPNISDKEKNYYFMHFYQISKVIRNNPNQLYKHIILYYENDELITKYSKDFIKFTKNIKQTLWYIITHGSTQFWTVDKFIRDLKSDEESETTRVNKDTELLNLNRKVVIKTVVFNKAKNINIQLKYLQTYQNDKLNICVYNGLLKYFDRDDKNYKQIYNKLVKNYDKYAKGYNNKELEEVASFCKSSIIIKDIINNNDLIINENTNNKFRITFINSKYNHLDLLTCMDNDVEEVEEQQYINIKKNSNFYIEKFGTLMTVDKKYKIVNDDFYNVFEEWKKEINFNTLFINKNNIEYDFINMYDYGALHRVINEDFIIDNNLYYELDIKKAYYNYSNKDLNKFYCGIPSGSFLSFNCDDTFDFNKLTNNKLIGFFEVEIKEHIKKNSDLDKLGFKIGSKHLLFTSTVLCLLEYIKFKFLNCCFAPSVHIPFNDKFIKKIKQKDGKNLPYYSKAYGIMLIENMEIITNIKPLEIDNNYYSILYNDTNNIYTDDKIIKIIEQVEDPKSYIHIAYSIHAYVKTLILNEILNIGVENVLGIKLDSIVIKNEYKYNFNNLLFSEDKKTNINLFKKTTSIDIDTQKLKINENEYYINLFIDCNLNENKFNESFTQSGEIIYNRLVYIGGKGGSGKTHSILTSKNLNKKNICFSSFCWNLIQEQQKKHPEIIGLSINKLIGLECEKTTNKNIKIIVDDELTLQNEKYIASLVSLYPNIFIFLLGDIDIKSNIPFQCSIDDKNIFKPSKFKGQIITYKKSFRFDEELNNLLDDVREKQLKLNKLQMYNYFIDKFNDRIFKKEDIIFNNDDIGISCKNNLDNDDLTKYFLNNGVKPQYYIKTTNLNKGELKGQKLDKKPDHTNYINTLFKTVHSFQGCELSQTNKIIINLDSIFDKALYYTAISRCRRREQIYIINNVKLTSNLNNLDDDLNNLC